MVPRQSADGQTATMETQDRGDDVTALPLLAQRALSRDPARRALEFDGHWYNWGDIRQVADAVATLIESAGVAPLAPIGLVARNRPAMIAALIGLLAAGRSVQMIYAFQSPAVIARDIEKLRPAAAVMLSQDRTDPVDAALATQGIAAIVLDDMSATLAPGRERANNQNSALCEEAQIQVLTSGTTGPPKRFPIPFDMIARHHIGGAGAQTATPEDEPPVLLFYPLGNISGIYSTIPTMLRGRAVSLLDRFSLDAWHQFILRYRPTASGIPPSAFRMLLDSDIPPEDLSSLHAMNSGAAPLDPLLQRAFEEKYRIPVLVSYGATEFGGPVAAMTLDLARTYGTAKTGSVGRAMAGARLQIIDPATGDTLPPGKEGLLEVATPRVGPDWIRTSDIALIDEDGFLFIRGRADGAIIRGGFKMLPETIERALLEHASIGAAAVIGVADSRLGHVPAAAIQLKAGARAMTENEAEAHLRDHLPATHIPVHWRFVEDLPKNPSMKIDRPAVARLFEA